MKLKSQKTMEHLTFLKVGLISESTQFQIDNANIIAVIGIAVTILYCLFSLYKVIDKSNSNNEKVEAFKKEGKTILIGRIILKNSNSFWNVGNSIITGYFYEIEDCIISIDGTSYYKNAIESSKLKIV